MINTGPGRVVATAVVLVDGEDGEDGTDRLNVQRRSQASKPDVRRKARKKEMVVPPVLKFCGLFRFPDYNGRNVRPTVGFFEILSDFKPLMPTRYRQAKSSQTNHRLDRETRTPFSQTNKTDRFDRGGGARTIDGRFVAITFQVT